MDFLPEKHAIMVWLEHYGAFALFALLALGIIALPIPDETLMVLSGIFIFKGKLSIYSTLIAAYAGSMCGITVSYLVGRLAGDYLLKRHGNWLGLTPEKVQQIHNWFEKYGKWTLSFGYFIPGVRHFTGFVAGMAELSYKHFALFAYLGAFVWVSTFISIGYFIGDYWLLLVNKFHFEFDADEIGAIIITLIFLIWLARAIFLKKKAKENP